MSQNQLIQRSSGVLLHPTSLPSMYGIGDLGPWAYRWIDFLRRSRQRWWQFLPLGPTGFADSPYQCFSAFAGNPYLISPEKMIEEGLLTQEEAAPPSFSSEYVEYGRAITFKMGLLSKAFEHFESGWARSLQPSFETFCHAQAEWLEDYALFMTLKEEHHMESWLSWEDKLIMRSSDRIQRERDRLSRGIRHQKFVQFLFFHQWASLRDYANQNGIRFIGDIPIFISSDSSDIWGFPEGFIVDETRKPKAVAGVPPDYFSATGQLWGNPLYEWKTHQKQHYVWWKKRLNAILDLVDLVRIDHFRGFEAYWEIPAGNPTAEIGRWVKGPGYDLFDHLLDDTDTLPIIAEDLGVITPEVDALREHYGFPGMRVLQFAFGGGVESRFLPHNYEDSNTVVYTGTHDNDTSRGFYEKASEYEKDFMRRYMACGGEDISWDMIRLAWSSIADLAITPLQDILSLDSNSRMNIPGVVGGNWVWRFLPEQLNEFITDRLGNLTELYGRYE